MRDYRNLPDAVSEVRPPILPVTEDATLFVGALRVRAFQHHQFVLAPERYLKDGGAGLYAVADRAANLHRARRVCCASLPIVFVTECAVFVRWRGYRHRHSSVRGARHKRRRPAPAPAFWRHQRPQALCAAPPAPAHHLILNRLGAFGEAETVYRCRIENHATWCGHSGLKISAANCMVHQIIALTPSRWRLAPIIGGRYVQPVWKRQLGQRWHRQRIVSAEREQGNGFACQISKVVRCVMRWVFKRK